MRDWSRQIQDRTVQGLYRQHQVHLGSKGMYQIMPDGGRCLNFCSNDYLGLANDPEVIAALCTAAQRYGVGAGSAHLVCGHQQIHEELEHWLCRWTHRQSALLFSSGWLANLAVVCGLVQAGEVVVQDRLNHASLLDAVHMVHARLQRYAHADWVAAQQRVQQYSPTLMMTDGVFSMDGDLAPLTELSAVAKSGSILLVVDDAHGLGVVGDQGQGWGGSFNEQDVPVLVVTFGKALGTQGACVLGSADLIEWLMQVARPYIYTTALSPALTAATLTAAKMAWQDVNRRNALRDNIAYWQAGAHALHLPLQVSTTAIQPLLVGSSERAMYLSQQLLQRGIWVTAIRPPTVPKNTARLRITMSALHTKMQIDQLLDTLNTVWPSDWRLE